MKLSALRDAESKNGERTVTVKADYVPSSDKDEEVALYVCVYAKMNGRKEMVSLSNPIFKETQNGIPCSAYASVSVPENKDGAIYSIECFFWHRSEGVTLNPIVSKTFFTE